MNRISILHPGEIRIGKEIGKGGFGTVYKAEQIPLDVPLAIKLFTPHIFNNRENALQRFYQEAEILMSLRHPYIVAVYGFGMFEDCPYILMEYFKGLNLQQVIEKFGSVKPSKILRFLLHACDAFHHAHEHPSDPVIHRDIKPSNLMTVKGDMRVLDFGIARRILPEESGLTTDGHSIVGGAYSDPELENNPRLVDPRCDVYGLGACWYYALTGRSPSGSNIEENLRSLEGMTKEYANVLIKCLSSLERRHRNMLELKADIQALSSEAPTPTTLDNNLTDNEQLLLGTLFSKYTPQSEAIPTWDIQQSLSNNLTDFQFSIALARLKEREFILDVNDQDWNGNEFKSLVMTSTGTKWTGANEIEIQNTMAALDQANTTQISEFDDDIPF